MNDPKLYLSGWDKIVVILLVLVLIAYLPEVLTALAVLAAAYMLCWVAGFAFTVGKSVAEKCMGDQD